MIFIKTEHEASKQTSITNSSSEDPKAGFGIRIVAFLVDLGFLCGLGHILIYTLYGVLLSLGPYAGWVGFVISLAYFGILFSRIGNGQTPGMKIFGIQVTDKSGEPPSLSKAVLRAFILVTPFYIGNKLFFFSYTELFWPLALGYLAFIMQAGLVYFYVCNKNSRQSLHDLVAGTYVTRLKTSPGVTVKKSEEKYARLFIAAAAILIYGYSVLIVQPHLQSSHTPLFARIGEEVQKFSGDPRVLVKDKGNDNDPFLFDLEITTHIDFDDTSREKYQNHIALITLRQFPEELLEKNKDTTLAITLRKGVDTGIANNLKQRSEFMVISEWEKRLGMEIKPKTAKQKGY